MASPARPQPVALARPPWLRVRFADGPNHQDLQELVRGHSLHTVCEEAHCPNIGECWEHRTATFMILGRICTRACRFCAVATGVPTEPDEDEPVRVAEAAAKMGLRHVVVTSVARDDLPDGGAAIFAETIRQIRKCRPDASIEVLIPDFGGDRAALRVVMDARPDILNHNMETVRRLQRQVRAKARYDRSLDVLRNAKAMDSAVRTKSGLMLGVGETWDEIVDTLRDLRAIACDIVTIGQYLRPSPGHLALERYYAPEEFAELKRIGLAMGFHHVESGPLVRSSYHAHEAI
ncbi:MAG: lipoyl synthase [Chloroflexi bacterium]|nr:lipoyl synthase [Chloroflexota bacterium]